MGSISLILSQLQFQYLTKVSRSNHLCKVFAFFFFILYKKFYIFYIDIIINIFLPWI